MKDYNIQTNAFGNALSKINPENKRFVYGTRSEKWHLVGPDDRDYSRGITFEKMKEVGPDVAKDIYLSPSLV